MRRAALLVAAGAVLLACGGDEDAVEPTTASSSTTVTRETTTTTTASRTSAPSSSSTTVVFSAPTEPTCVDGATEASSGATQVAVAGGEGASVEVGVDVDGPFLVLRQPDSVGLTPLEGGAELGPPPRVAAVLDLDGDGSDEVWIQAGSGASVLLFRLYRVDGCLLAPVVLDGVPSSFAVGGTVLNQAGLFCTDSGAVVAVVASSDDGERYLGDRIDYRLVGGELVEQRTEPFELLASDPAFPDLAAFRC